MGNPLKKLIKEEIQIIFRKKENNVFEGTSQILDDVENSYFSSDEWKKFKKIYEIALNIKKTNLAALYFLELTEKLKFLNQNSIHAQQFDNLAYQIKRLIPYFLQKDKKGNLTVIKFLNDEETYWVKLQYNTIFDEISYNTINPHIVHGSGNKSFM